MRYEEVMGGEHAITLEDMGRKELSGVELVATYDADTGEPRTWDYPGSAPSAAISEVKVTSFFSGEFEVARNESGWFELLDKIAMERMHEVGIREFEDEILDSLSEAWEDHRG